LANALVLFVVASVGRLGQIWVAVFIAQIQRFPSEMLNRRLALRKQHYRKKSSLNWTCLISAQTSHPQPSLAKAEKAGYEVRLWDISSVSYFIL
jgi:hypothetical protein